METRANRLFWVLACLMALVIGAMPVIADDETDSLEEDAKLFKIFSDSVSQISSNYVKEVSKRQLIEAAIRGMLQELDPYSNYIDPKELKQFNDTVEQQFGGIGIKVSPELMIMTPLPGTPAYRAGVLAGDRIVEINGEPTSKYPKNRRLDVAISKLKGKPGQEVSIGVRRVGFDGIKEIKIVRAIIKVASVFGDKYIVDEGTGNAEDVEWDFMLDKKNKIGYIRLSHFGRRSTKELKSALEVLKRQGMRGLVLDLRFNPGGLLQQAITIADLFVDTSHYNGVIVTTRRRTGRASSFRATDRGTYSDFPMAVIVNHYSASASEIVSACLQDHKRAVVFGERSWGKGSVQNVIELEGGTSALKLTTAGYFRPSGKNIHREKNDDATKEWGVSPLKDNEVRYSARQNLQYNLYRRERDVISKDGPPKSDYQDRQLNKSLEYVLAKLSDKKASDKKDADKTAVKKTDKKNKDAAATKEKVEAKK